MNPRRFTSTLAATWFTAAAGSAFAAPPAPWSLAGTPAAASVTGGPWTLAQAAAPAHAATLGTPRDGMCVGGSVSAHVGTDLMQPYYFPLTFRKNDHTLVGYFDYRVKDNEEMLAYGTSDDGGMTWSVVSTALQLNDGLCGSSNLTDNGQGHASVLRVNDSRLVYTLDRAATPSFLLAHALAGGPDPLASLPADEPVSGNTVPATATQVQGLLVPDGITDVLPGFRDDGAIEVLYLSKDKGHFTPGDPGACPTDSGTVKMLSNLGKKPNQDLAVMRLAHTSDGINFVDDGAATFDKIDPTDTNTAYTSTRFIGPRGTVLHYEDGSYGLFFSGGNCGDGDSDAYHYIGYAHSADGRSWTVDNDINNPLVSVDYANMGTSDAERHHYTGRVYAPTVTFDPNGKAARLIFSGYNTPQPLPSTKASALLGVPTPNYQPVATQATDYRAIMNVPLSRGSAPKPILGDE